MSGIQIPGRGNATANPLEVLNRHLENLVQIAVAQAQATQTIAQHIQPNIVEQLVVPHVPAVLLTESGAWGVFCLGCTHAATEQQGDGPPADFVYPCEVVPEDADHPWPPQFLMEVPESPESHEQAPS